MTRHPRALLLVLLALLASALTLAVPGVHAAARTGAVPRSECARYDHGVADGVCARDSHGGIYWLGTLRGYDGVEMYCIDFHLATSWGVEHHRYLLGGSLPTSLGRRVPASAAAALTYLVTRYPAASAGTTTAAALGLIIREVMGDVRRPYGQMIPGGLTVERDVRRVSFVPGDVESRATSLWREARAHRGPWRLSVTVAPGPDHRVSPGEQVQAQVRGTSGSGHPQDMAAHLSYAGFTGPSSVRLGSDGVASVTLTAAAVPRSATVAVRVDGAPGEHPLLVRPVPWHPNPHPGYSSSISQRGLIATQGAVKAAALVVVEVHYGPSVATTTSQAEAVAGATLTDAVVITGADPDYAGPVTATLYGPFGSAPDAQSCLATSVVGSVTMPVHGDGAYTTPGVKVAAPGYYTWVETLPATASQDLVRTPCGSAAETTVVRAGPQLLTRTSAPVVEVGTKILDRVRVTGMPRGVSVVATARLYGPFAASSSATCTGTPYATVHFRVTGDGDYLTPGVRLGAAGIYTWVESLPGDELRQPVTTGCGLRAETTLAHRTPPVPSHPSVPAGGSSTGGRR